MKLEEFKSKLAAHGLEKYFDQLEPIFRNSVRLYQKETDENNIAIGQTKIGGRPDLPKEIAWVTETNTEVTNERKFLLFNSKKEVTVTKPLSFIAQINLSEIASFDKDNLLPKTGLLYFFYAAEQDAWGFDYKDKNKFKVVYWDGPQSTLSRADFPKDLPEEACYKACAVEIESEISLPGPGHEVYEHFAEGDDNAFWDEVFEEGEINKLLGYADNIQEEMELECELVTNGLYCGDPSGYNDPRAATLEPYAKDWRLLLQIDSNEDAEMMWGDCGRLYFWIKEQDLKNKDFDKSWFCVQCS